MTAIIIPNMGVLTLPDDLLGNLRTVHGRSAVESWTEGLPSMLAGILDELNARIVPGDPPLSYHLVFFAEQNDGQQIVVKCTVPNHEQPPEVAAVQALSDAAIGPRLLWVDMQRGTLVMERVRPGSILPTALPSLTEDAEITRQLARLSTRIVRETDAERWRDALVPVREYSRAIGEVDPTSALWEEHRDDIERALELRERLLAESDHVVLHGDLHHYNVLLDQDGQHRVIDPKGLVGPPGYDFGALTYNPMGIQLHPELAALERQRVDIWSEVTGVPWETVRSWGYVAAVLSACWSGQGGAMAWTHAMQVATTLRDLEPLR